MAKSMLNKYGWLFAVAAVFFLVLLIWAPKPTAEGSCSIVCTSGTTFVDAPAEGESIDLSGICNPTGQTCSCCEVTGVTENVALYGWQVDWKCCNCAGDAELALPACGTNPLGPIYGMLGLCI